MTRQRYEAHDAATIQRALDMYAGGMTTPEISTVMGLARSTVYQWRVTYMRDGVQIAKPVTFDAVRHSSKSPEVEAAVLRDAVLSECRWLLKGNATAQAAVSRYVRAMRSESPAWWRSRGDKSLAWWLNMIAVWAEGRAAA